LKQEHSELLEQIKTHREHCGEFSTTKTNFKIR